MGLMKVNIQYLTTPRYLDLPLEKLLLDLLIYES